MTNCAYCRTELKKENSVEINTLSLLIILARNAQMQQIWSNIIKRDPRARISTLFMCKTCHSIYIPSPAISQD